MPSASTSTVSVNSSREPVPATRSSSHGITRLPTPIVNATSAAIFAAVIAERRAPRLEPRVGANSAGSSTSATTVNRSSTTSQPTAIWPVGVCRSRLSARTRISTTVLATASAMPKTMPAGQPHPNADRDRRAQQRGDRALDDRARDRHAADGEQLLDVKLQADAEHQQDDADLGELLGDVRVGDEAWRVAVRPAMPASR